MLSLFLKVAVVLLLATAVSSQVLIYQDYTLGFSTTLPNGGSSAVEAGSYPTLFPGSFTFSVTYNGDPADLVSINIPGSPYLTLTANDPDFCLESPQLTSSTIPQCNYTVSWTAAFSGVMTVTYDSDGTSPPTSIAISTFFNTFCPS